jgi:hypothetical protein
VLRVLTRELGDLGPGSESLGFQTFYVARRAAGFASIADAWRQAGARYAERAHGAVIYSEPWSAGDGALDEDTRWDLSIRTGVWLGTATST